MNVSDTQLLQFASRRAEIGELGLRHPCLVRPGTVERRMPTFLLSSAASMLAVAISTPSALGFRFSLRGHPFVRSFAVSCLDTAGCSQQAIPRGDVDVYPTKMGRSHYPVPPWISTPSNPNLRRVPCRLRTRGNEQLHLIHDQGLDNQARHRDVPHLSLQALGLAVEEGLGWPHTPARQVGERRSSFSRAPHPW